MTFFRFDIDSRSRMAGRFIGRVRRELLRAIKEEKRGGLTQQELARRLETRRSDINRQLSGEAEITLRSLADLAWALDREVTVELRRADGQAAQNIAGQNIEPATATIGYQPVRIIAPGIIAPKTSNG
jgi:transcriptional regulator with XRE-family HTH domain